MASILDPQIKLDVNGSMIDCNWYYGCLISPRKIIDIDACFNLGHCDAHTDGNDTNHSNLAKGKRLPHEIAKEAKDEQTLREEDRGSSSHCFGSSDFNSAYGCEEDPDEEVEYLASMFRILDEDCDGRVSAAEVMRFLQRLSLEMPEEEVELAVRSISACGDEFLTDLEFAEFYSIIFDKEEEVDHVKLEEQAICEAFSVFDQNGDGFISATELADILSRLGFVEGRDVNRCQNMIENVDCNGDGLVDIDEFRNLITRSTYPPLQCVVATN